ncbi:MAG: TolC family protein, partial [Longimicrobiales bacterium]
EIPGDPLAGQCSEPALTEDAAVASAIERREELAQVRAGMDAARSSVRLATASYLPSVALALDYGFQGNTVRFGSEDDFGVASIVVSWNPFSGGQHAARRQAAKADVQRLRARLAEAEDLVRLDVRQAHEAASVAFRAIETAEAQLAAARRSFQLVQRRWEEGLSSPIEFLDARTALTNAALNRSVTIYRYAIRHVDLERAAALRDLDRNE